MPTFVYEGKSRAGRPVTGELEAKDQQELLNLLRRNQIQVTKVKRKPRELNIVFGTGVTIKDITQFSRQFATMIGAGLPLVQCLNILSEQTVNPNFRKILLQITQDVQSGNTLADSLAKHRKVFGDLFVHMVEAGEAGGILENILLRLASYLEKSAALKRKIKGAMTYPMVIGAIALVATVAMLTFVVPTFAKMFADMGGTLPKPTLIVMALSKFVKGSIVYLVIIGIFSFIGFKRFTATPTGRLLLDRFIFALPVIGDMQKKTSIARFSRTLSTLLGSGVSILDALDITARTAGNRVIHDAIKRMVSNIAGGKTIVEPMKQTGVFPSMVTQMVGVGEQTGGLEIMLAKVADFYEEEVDASVEVLTALMEPVIMVFLAVIMGGMLLAMYLPMFDLINQVKG